MFQCTALLLSLISADDPTSTELDRHQGIWNVVASVREGKAIDRAIAQSIVRIVEGNRVVWKRDGKSFAGTKIVLDPKADPPTIDVIPEGGPAFAKRVLGIYQLSGDELMICMADADKPRPREFVSGEAGSGLTLQTFRRAGP
ncbi:MAG: TIGR03067 domain-containing protein [Isosphaeraceae bacterium]